MLYPGRNLTEYTQSLKGRVICCSPSSAMSFSSSGVDGPTKARRTSGTCNVSRSTVSSQTCYRLDAHLSVLETQFSKPKRWTQDGYSDFFNFSTGRRNVASLHTIFTLRPRHDFFQWAFQTARTFIDLQYRPVDDLQLDFKLFPEALAHDFVWAVVSKDELLSVKTDRWDLVSWHSTIPAVSDRSQRPGPKPQKTRVSRLNSQ